MLYSPPFFLFNNHLETIYPALIRKVNFEYQRKERITTPDDDFLEIGFSSCHSDTLVIISHGLEGDMERPYMRGMAKACFENGYDVVAWNFRGCGSDLNKQLRFYHSGETDDLDTIVNYFLVKNNYSAINLVGFSLGGNITLKYVGEVRTRSSILKKVVAISVPMHLSTSCKKISEPANRIYHHRFLKSLKSKIINKSKIMQGLDIEGIDSLKTIKAFDDRYTAPLHGYLNADEYYSQCSSVRFVEAIKIPTLIINAANDPFLSEECYPVELLKNHPFVKFEKPSKGGHVGFAILNKKNLYWSEQMALEFLSDK